LTLHDYAKEALADLRSFKATMDQIDITENKGAPSGATTEWKAASSRQLL